MWPVVILFTTLNVFGRLYHGRGSYPSMPVSPIEEFRRLVLSSVGTHLTVMAFLGFAHRQTDVSRVVLAASGVLTALSVQYFRNLMRTVLKGLGIGQIPAFLVGEGAAAEQVRREMADSDYHGFTIVESFRRDRIGKLVKSARKKNVRHVFFCYGESDLLQAQLPELLKWFSFIEYLPMTSMFPVEDARPVMVGSIGGLEMINQRQLRMLAREKTLLDGLLSLFIALCTLPLLIVVPILIKLTSRGPVFYKAKRLGRNGRTIYVWKFRSMCADAEQRLDEMLASNPKLREEYDQNFKLRNDGRVTRLGRFLRKTSIDELPQLFNVLSGDMALIGPRPIVEREVAYYGDAYEVVSAVKPGITGLWQCSGRNDCGYRARVALDLKYVMNWSPWMDIWIVFRTVAAVLCMRGAV